MTYHKNISWIGEREKYHNEVSGGILVYPDGNFFCKTEIDLIYSGFKKISNFNFVVSKNPCIVREDTSLEKKGYGLESNYYGFVNDVPFVIVDNHNIVFYSWWCYRRASGMEPVSLVHIDQHSDMEYPEIYLEREVDEKKVWHYVMNDLKIATFIQPALVLGIIGNVFQVRSEFALLNLDISGKYILDIDLDYFVPLMTFNDEELVILTIAKLFMGAEFVTFAFSPLFIDFDRAQEYLQKIMNKVIELK